MRGKGSDLLSAFRPAGSLPFPSTEDAKLQGFSLKPSSPSHYTDWRNSFLRFLPFTEPEFYCFPLTYRANYKAGCRSLWELPQIQNM